MAPLTLVINRASGTFERSDGDALQQSLERHPAVGEVWPLDDGLADRIRDGKPEAIAIAGGDGTICAVTDLVWQSEDDIALLPLPLGTANLLVKRLYGDQDAIALLDKAASAPVRPVRPGLAGDTPFLVAAALGFPTTLARAREKLRDPDGPLPFPSFSRRVWASLQQAFKPRMRYRTDNTKPGYQRASGLYLDLDALDGDDFSLVQLHWRELRDMALTGLSLFGTDTGRPEPLSRTHELIATARKPLAVMLDGEPSFIPGPLTFRRADRPLTFLDCR